MELCRKVSILQMKVQPDSPQQASSCDMTTMQSTIARILNAYTLGVAISTTCYSTKLDLDRHSLVAILKSLQYDGN